MSLSILNRGTSILALAVVLAMGAATAQSVERFRLFNNCEPMNLVVEGLRSPGAAEIGLTEGAIQAAVESRLRSARLYSDHFANSYLYVNVSVIGVAFHISLAYGKEVLDLASGLRNWATTWDGGFTGIQSSGASYILSSISGLMDDFLVEYLRVNDEAC